MSESLLSVGLDVGTTSTQLVVSRLRVENRAGAFAVPSLRITDRQVVYQSPVYFTPLKGEQLVDGPALAKIVEEEYRRAGIARGSVDTGAVIITGETGRKENARQVLSALSELAGDFVVASAGPDLESVLAAKGAGAVEYSRETGKTVLHMDIGGGTANLALIREGKIIRTGCLNVGGRLLRFTPEGRVSYVSPALQGLWNIPPGERADRQQVMALARILAGALEEAAGIPVDTPAPESLWTREVRSPWAAPEEVPVLSFSGGVADCIREERAWLTYGDMGPELGQAIRESRLCRGPYRLGSHTIRATVIGAGSYSTRLSGSTVFHRNVEFPLKNLQVAALDRQQQEQPEEIARALAGMDGPGVLALPGFPAPDYDRVTRLADTICRTWKSGPVTVCLEGDMAKALGQALALRLPGSTPILCLDRLQPEPDSFLDVGTPLGPALPVVIKTLVLGEKV